MTNLNPTNLDANEVHSRSLTAFFDTREAADRAIRDLESAGIPRQHISRIDGGTSSASATTGQGGTGFWDSLKDLFMPDEDRYGYAEGLRRGGYMVSVRAEEASYNRVLEILDRDGAVDMDQREASWRSEGWAGYQAEAGRAVTGAATSAATTAGYAATGAASRPVAQAAAASDARSLRSGEDEVIPIYEEQLRVGKRDVSHGRVRLRSYTVETPVNEQVTLRSERVDVERHAVDRPVSATDAMFQDRAIELEETAEEAVVSKQARVVEEISLRKEAHDRTETITDKVRRTEVEIEDERRGHSLQTTTEAGTVPPKTDPTRKV